MDLVTKTAHEAGQDNRAGPVRCGRIREEGKIAGWPSARERGDAEASGAEAAEAVDDRHRMRSLRCAGSGLGPGVLPAGAELLDQLMKTPAVRRLTGQVHGFRGIGHFIVEFVGF